MKYLKGYNLFEKIDIESQDLDFSMIEDSLINLTDYHNLRILDVNISTAMELPEPITKDPSLFKRKNTYNCVSVELKRTSDINYTYDFYEDLKHSIKTLEKIFNLKFKCIYKHSPGETWWIETIDLFKKEIEDNSIHVSILKKPFKLDLMFEII